MSTIGRLFRWLGAVASAAAALLWVALVLSPVGRESMTAGSYLVAASMVALAAVGLRASIAWRPKWMFLIFAVSFFPIGFYLLGAVSFSRFIGWANLVYLAAAIGRQAVSRAKGSSLSPP